MLENVLLFSWHKMFYLIKYNIYNLFEKIDKHIVTIGFLGGKK